MSSRLKVVFLWAALLAALPARAVEMMVLDVGNLQGEGILVRGLRLSLALARESDPVLRIAAERVEIADQAIAPARIDCLRFSWSRELIQCSKGRLHAGHPRLDRPGADVDLSWNPLKKRLRLSVSGLRLAGGGADLDLTADMTGGEVARADWRVTFRDLRFSAGDGEVLAEGLSGDARGDWRGAGGRRGEAALSLLLSKGELLTPYLYLNPGNQPVTLAAELSWDPVQQRLELQRVNYTHPGLVTLTGSGSVSTQPLALKSVSMDSGETDAAALYRAYFQPLLGSTLLESVAWQGSFQLSVRQQEQGPARVSVRLMDLGLEDAPDRQLYPDLGPRFALRGLTGALHWSDTGETEITRLSWRDGHLLGSLEIGAAALEAVLQGGRFHLNKDVEIPLLDGSLWVERLDVSAVPQGKPELDFDAVLTPVTLSRLSSAFGWPELHGSLSGVLPGLTLRQDGLRVDGKLLVRAFDGDLLIENLRLNGLFGSWPELLADVRVTGLDLEQLTGAFSFGKITGRLDGRVEGLRLENWQPVAFDAHFATPPGDESEHTISQRAVDNISNLGGAGIGGSLSRTFLGMFESFGYERIGIGCKLRDGVCRMSGVQAAERGYDLVIGRGIPQINIKGFNTETDWNRLVQQLQQISAGGAPIIQ